MRKPATPTRKGAAVARRPRVAARATRAPRTTPTPSRARRPAAQIFDLRLASDDPSPVYQQLVDQLRLLVSTGELPPGSRLPSARHLAANLGVNRNTALRAYMVLAREGVFEGRRGGGPPAIGPRGRADHRRRPPPAPARRERPRPGAAGRPLP